MARTDHAIPLDEPCRKFGQTLEVSRLLSSEQLRAARDKLRRGKGKSHPVVVAAWLVEEGVLTRWQAEQLLAGRTAFCLGKYTLIEKIGSGGMGAVYKAQQSGFGRTVAIKLMDQEFLEKQGSLDRFLREIRAIGKLQHPNIVSAYDADQVGDRHFLVLEYAEGQDLEQLLQQTGKLPIPTACEIIVQAAMGLQHAFERGIVHRDIKPGNLLITQGSSGRFVVKILDMGLARFARSGENASLTKSGQIMGTPDYMAPEQVEDTRNADIRADIYSLGSTLFELLTGQVPFAGGAATRRLMARLAGDAPKLRKVAPEMPAELERIVTKMLARQPDDRYATPAEVIAELLPFAQSGIGDIFTVGPAKSSADTNATADMTGKDLAELVAAVKHTSTSIGLRADLDRSLDDFGSLLQNIGSTSREVERNIALAQSEEESSLPWLWIAIAAGVFLALSIGGYAWFALGATTLVIDMPPDERTGLVEIDGEQKQVPKKGPLIYPGRPGERQLRLTRAGYEPAVAKVAFARGEEKTFRPQWKPLPDTARRLAWESLEKEAGEVQSLPPLDPKLRDFTNRVVKERAVQSGLPDAKRALPILDKLRNPLELYDAAKIPASAVYPPMDRAAPLVAVFPGNDAHMRFWSTVNKVIFTPDHRKIMAAAHGGPRIIDLETKEVVDLDHSAIYSGDISADGAIGAFSDPSYISIFDMKTCELQYQLPQSYVYSMDFAADGNHLLAGGTEGELNHWKLERGAELPEAAFPKLPGDVSSCCYSMDGKSAFAVSSGDFKIRQFDVGSKTLSRTLEGHEQLVYQLAVSKTGLLASSSADSSIRLWDVATGKHIRSLTGSEGAVTAVAFTPDGLRLLSGDSNYELRLWDVETGKLLDAKAGHWSTINSIAVGSNGKIVATAGADQTIRTWTLEDDKLTDTTIPPAPWLIAASISADSTMIAASAVGGDVLVWDVPSLEPRMLLNHGSRIPAIQFAPYGNLLATGGYDYRVVLTDAKTGWGLNAFAGHTSYVYAVAFSNDGRFIASAGADLKICIWNIEQGKLERELFGHEYAISSLAWSPDGKLLASGDGNYELKLWDVEKGTLLRSRRFENGGVQRLSFSPDGSTIAFANYCSAQRWNIVENKDELIAAEQNVIPVVFSPRGNALAFAHLYGSLEIYKLDRGAYEFAKWQVGGKYAGPHQLAYSSDGRFLLATNTNGTAYLFRVEKPSPAP